MSRAAVLALAILASCCADDDAGKTLVASAGGEDSSSSAGDEGTTDASDESSGDASSSTGDPDACPDWCTNGCPPNNSGSPWFGQEGLCVCVSEDDCWPDGVSQNLQCVGYDPGVDPGHTHQLGRCVPVE